MGKDPDRQILRGPMWSPKLVTLLAFPLVVLAMVLSIAYQKTMSNEHLLRAERERVSLLETNFNATLAMTVQSLQRMSCFVAHDPEIRRTFLSGVAAWQREGRGSGGPETDQYRKQLFDQVKDAWLAVQDQLSARQLHFHIGPGDTSFLRVHAPSKFGDDLSDVRFTIVDAIKQGKRTGGFERGRIYAGVRGVVPIKVKDDQAASGTRTIGALESGLSFETVLSAIKDRDMGGLAVVLPKSHLSDAMWPEYFNRWSQRNLAVGDLVVEASTDPRIEDLLDNPVLRDMVVNPGSQVRWEDDHWWGISTFPVRDYRGQEDESLPPVGAVVIWRPLDDAVAAASTELWRHAILTGILGVLSLVGLFAATHFVQRALQHTIDSQVRDLRESAERLQDAHRRLGLALEGTDATVWECNLVSQVMYLDAPWQRKLGFQDDGDEPLLCSHWQERIHREDAIALETSWYTYLTDPQGVFNMEYRIRNAHGQWIWVDMRAQVSQYDQQGKPVAAMGTMIEITQRKQHELALAQQKRLVEQIIDHAPVGIWLVKEDGSYPIINRAFAEAVNWGRPNFSMTRQELEGCWKTDQIVRDTGQAQAFEERVTGADGQPHVLQTVKTALLDEQGQVMGVLGIGLDVTERKHAEAEREKLMQDIARARLEAENANTAKSQFLANMSHEIRTPMTAMLGYADLLRDASLDQRQRLEFIDVIRHNGDHLLGLINDILDLSKIEAGRLEAERIAFDPHLVVQQVATLLKPRALAKSLTLQVHTTSSIPKQIMGDPARLRQVLNNLIGNAVKFTQQGRIDITVSAQRYAEGYTDADATASLEIEIRDTGIGITSDQLARLFKPFTQADASTNRKFGGSGLGLAISHHLVELMGGELQVTSTAGEGSSFTLHFNFSREEIEHVDWHVPVQSMAVDAPEAASGGPAVQAAGAAPLKGIRVMLAEDGPDNRRMIQLRLERLGASVDVAANGREAVNQTLSHRRGEKAFDVILMDMQMPEVDGYSATRTLRHKTLSTPIIALTAHAMTRDREKCLAAGCDEHVTKPVDFERLTEVILHLVDVPSTRGIADPFAGAFRTRSSQDNAPIDAGHPSSPGESRELKIPDQTRESSALDDARDTDRDGQTQVSQPVDPHEPLISTLLASQPDFAPLVAQFVNEMPDRIDALRQAHDAGSLDQLRTLSHQLKGAAGGYGFEPITDAAASLEALLKHDQVAADAEELLDRMNDLIGLCQAAQMPEHADT